ncbi:hypothetical protein TMatcc_009582 [Talaromyces marneffei ATCC 18224]
MYGSSIWVASRSLIRAPTVPMQRNLMTFLKHLRIQIREISAWILQSSPNNKKGDFDVFILKYLHNLLRQCWVTVINAKRKRVWSLAVQNHCPCWQLSRYIDIVG